MRTLEQALAYADSLRDFRKTNEEAFQRSNDLQDIVLLADEVNALRLITDTDVAENQMPDNLYVTHADESW